MAKAYVKHDYAVTGRDYVETEGGGGGAGGSYSTEKHQVGTWIDGSPIYEITIDVAPLPNNTSASFDIDADLNRVISMEGYAIESTDKWNIFFNDVSTIALMNNIRVYANVSSKKLYVQTGFDMSSYTEAYVTVRYTTTE